MNTPPRPRPSGGAARRLGWSVACAAAVMTGASGCVIWALDDDALSPSSSAASSAPAPTTTAPSSTPSTAPGWKEPWEIPVGACVDMAEGMTKTVFRQVECTEWHDAQVVSHGVFGSPTVPEEDSPAERRLFEEQCTPAFKALTGTAWDDSRLSMTTVLPTPEQFKRGNRTLTCIIVMYDWTRFRRSAIGAIDETHFDHEPTWKEPTDADLFDDEEEQRS